MKKIVLLILLSFVVSYSQEHYYWEKVSYDKWYDVPREKLIDRESQTEADIPMNSALLSYYIQLYKEADFIGVLQAKKYKKVSCDIESSTCGEYKAKVLTVFKVDKKIKNLIFYNDLGEAPTVYADKTIYVLYKGEEMYFQDMFVRTAPTKELIDFFNKLSKGKVEINNKIFKSLYSFCKATGIKESEIRKLNPWINKNSTNISVNAEIVVPIIHKK